jgi:hypothetical protein
MSSLRVPTTFLAALTDEMEQLCYKDLMREMEDAPRRDPVAPLTAPLKKVFEEIDAIVQGRPDLPKADPESSLCGSQWEWSMQANVPFAKFVYFRLPFIFIRKIQEIHICGYQFLKERCGMHPQKRVMIKTC